ncbi:oligosaccharide repeat unit polymerase [bacterium]|nr:oligosaccharide repeat unit polymerase [bacterium]
MISNAKYKELNILFIIANVCLITSLIVGKGIQSYYNLIFLSTVLTTVCVLVTISKKNDYLNPSVWFSWGITLYSTASPILFILGYDFNRNITMEYRVYSLELAIISVFIINMISGLSKPNTSFKIGSKDNIVYNGCIIIMPILLFFGAIVLLVFLRSGISTKGDKLLYGSKLANADFIFTCQTVIFSFIYAYNKRLGFKFKPIITIILTIYFALTFLILGERDIIIRFILVIGLIYYLLGNNKQKHYFRTGILVCLFSISILQPLKNALVKENSVVYEVSEFSGALKQSNNSLHSLFLILYGSEFRSAGENLGILLTRTNNQFDYGYGKIFLNELSLVFQSSLFGRREGNESLTFWFARTFYPSSYDKGHGFGFTIIGQGLLDGGLLGVIVLISLISFLTTKLYKNSQQSIFMLCLYINLLPLMLYSIRGTIGTIVSPFIKHVLVFLILALVIGKTVNNNRYIHKMYK